MLLYGFVLTESALKSLSFLPLNSDIIVSMGEGI